MNLKDAFQTQNAFNRLSDRATEYLEDDGISMTVKEKHFRSKAVAGQPDEELDVTNYDAKRFPTDGVIKFLFHRIITVFRRHRNHCSHLFF